MNININVTESMYQRELIDKFKDEGWNEIDKNRNEANEHLNSFNKDLLGDFLIKRYPNINEVEINSIFMKIESKTNSNDWNENNKNGILGLVKNGVTTNFTEENGMPPYFLVDFKQIENNILSIQEEVWINYNSRVDVVQYINGLPIYIWELKSFKENKKILIDKAIEQIKDYTDLKNPKVMAFNLGLLVSQTIDSTFIGSPSAVKEFWFKPVNNSGDISKLLSYFTIERIMNYLKWGTLFKKSRTDKTKIILRPHQYEAVININNSLTNKNGGYIWHTQGSGKTITIAALISSMTHFDNNSSITTIIDVDRNELVNNIYQTISSFDENNISTNIKKAKSSSDLKNYLENSQYRGVIVTTTQKFSNWNQILSKRDDLLLISDEAHRTHTSNELSDEQTYLEKIKEALPNAIKLGFTGTPLFKSDRSTYEEFGNELHKYTMKDAEQDGIITSISSSFAEIRLKLNEENKLPNIDAKYIRSSKVTNESIERNEELTSEIKRSFEENRNQHKIDGKMDTYKAMVVTSSIKQGWIVYNMLKSKMQGTCIKFVASPNRENQSKEIYDFLIDKHSQENWIAEFKDPSSSIEIMVVTDKLLTGYDVPNLRMMYIDKEIREHNLLQTIARVNRRFKDKESGYITYFRNIKKELIEALTVYRDSTGDRSELISFVESSEYLFENPIKDFEKIIEIKMINSGFAMYVNEIAYNIKNLNENDKKSVVKSLDEIHRTSQIVHRIDTDILKYKVRLLLLVRSVINKNDEDKMFIKFTDEEFKNILKSVEVDGEITYSLINKNLDDILSLKDFIPEKELLEEIGSKAIKEIKDKTKNKIEEQTLIEKLRKIIDNYNNDLSEMELFVNEVNQIKSINDQLEEPSRWTEYFTNAFKKHIGEITLEQAREINRNLKEAIDEWYSTETSIRQHKQNLNVLLKNKELFKVERINISKIINEYIETSRKEWV